MFMLVGLETFHLASPSPVSKPNLFPGYQNNSSSIIRLDDRVPDNSDISCFRISTNPLEGTP